MCQKASWGHAASSSHSYAENCITDTLPIDCWLEERFCISWRAHSSIATRCYLLAQFASFRQDDRCILSRVLCVLSENPHNFLGKESSSPDKDGVSSLSPRSWPWLRAAVIGNAQFLVKAQCSLSRYDVFCLWVAAPLCTLGSRRAIGHNRHEGNEAMVADDLKEERTQRTHF